MIPGELRTKSGWIECNKGREKVQLRVSNTGDRPIQVGSHFHFAEVNCWLSFDREKAIGTRLNIAAGTAVRFEPGEEKEVELVALGGNRIVYGLNNLTQGSVDNKGSIVQRMKDQGMGVKEQGLVRSDTE